MLCSFTNFRFSDFFFVSTCFLRIWTETETRTPKNWWFIQAIIVIIYFYSASDRHVIYGVTPFGRGHYFWIRRKFPSILGCLLFLFTDFDFAYVNLCNFIFSKLWGVQSKASQQSLLSKTGQSRCNTPCELELDIASVDPQISAYILQLRTAIRSSDLSIQLH